MLPASIDSNSSISLADAGLLLGAQTRLAGFAGRGGRLALDPQRLEALFAVAFGRGPTSCDTAAFETAARHWQKGDKALANLRLVFAGLPRLHEAEDAVRLKAAELLFDSGLRADDLAEALGVEPAGADLGKYDPDQPRVPAGSGKTSGRWTALWSRFSAWLDEEVPVYDQDTGIQYGTQSRARSILTSPLTASIAGVGMLLGGEALLPGAAAAAVDAPVAVFPVVEQSEALAPFAQRYLSTSGGRLGSTATRKQLYEIGRGLVKLGKYEEYQGDGMGPEEYISSLRSSTKGSTYVDLTAKASDGTSVRIQTIDTLKDGVTPIAREVAAAARIRAAYPTDKLILIPKAKP